MRKYVFLYPAVFFLLILSVHGVGLAPAITRLDFKPGTYNFTFYARADQGKQTLIAVTLKGGAFLEHVEVEPKEYLFPSSVRMTVPESGIIPFSFVLKIPEGFRPSNPGFNGFAVLVSDTVSSKGQISVTTAVEGKLLFFVPYPGKYVDVKLSISNVNVNQSADLNLQLTSRGEEDIINTRAIAEITDKNDTLMDTLHINNVNIKAGEKKTITEKIHSENYKPGTYFGKVTYFYGTSVKEAEASFKVGTLRIGVLEHTEQLIVGKINKFQMVVENQWNNILVQVYAECKIHGVEFKTPTLRIKNFGRAKLNGYVDTTGFPLGEAELRCSLYFREKDSDELHSSNFVSQVEIVDEVEEVPEKIPEEKPAKKFDSKFILIPILIAIVLAVIVFDVIWIKRRKKEGQ